MKRRLRILMTDQELTTWSGTKIVLRDFALRLSERGDDDRNGVTSLLAAWPVPPHTRVWEPSRLRLLWLLHANANR